MKKAIRYRLLAVGEQVEDGDEEYSANELMGEPEAWRPVAAEFIDEPVQESDPPVRRATTEAQRADGNGFMELGKALEIVLGLARLAHSHSEVGKRARCPEEATTAMDTVEDFIVNHFEENDEVRNQNRHERFSALFEAMELHGNAEGTETQMGDLC